MNGNFNNWHKYVCESQPIDSFARFFAKFFDQKNDQPRSSTVPKNVNSKYYGVVIF